MKIYLFKLKILLGASLATLLLLLGIIALLLKSNFEDEGVVWFYVQHIQGGRSCANGARQKVWTRTKMLSLNIRYFVAN